MEGTSECIPERVHPQHLAGNHVVQPRKNLRAPAARPPLPSTTVPAPQCCARLHQPTPAAVSAYRAALDECVVGEGLGLHRHTGERACEWLWTGLPALAKRHGGRLSPLPGASQLPWGGRKWCPPNTQRRRECQWGTRDSRCEHAPRYLVRVLAVHPLGEVGSHLADGIDRRIEVGLRCNTSSPPTTPVSRPSAENQSRHRT